MRAALLCADSAEKLFIIEQCRAVCGPLGIAFSRVGGRDGKRHLQRCFLRKRGAAGSGLDPSDALAKPESLTYCQGHTPFYDRIMNL